MCPTCRPSSPASNRSLAVFELMGPELLRELVQGVLLDPGGDYPPPVGKEPV